VHEENIAMREQVLNTALSLDTARPFAALARYVTNWRNRRKLYRLGDLDDHLLADIGIERGEIEEALRLPLTLNPLYELDRRAHLRRTRGQRRP
jgi:uncharacterized protein YjiS (DUF1127 family)